jgi:hypothetical protein
VKLREYMATTRTSALHLSEIAEVHTFGVDVLAIDRHLHAARMAPLMVPSKGISDCHEGTDRDQVARAISRLRPATPRVYQPPETWGD